MYVFYCSPHNSALRWAWYHVHFTDEKTETGAVTLLAPHPTPHSGCRAGPPWLAGDPVIYLYRAKQMGTFGTSWRRCNAAEMERRRTQPEGKMLSGQTQERAVSSVPGPYGLRTVSQLSGVTKCIPKPKEEAR